MNADSRTKDTFIDLSIYLKLKSALSSNYGHAMVTFDQEANNPIFDLNSDPRTI